MVVYERKAQIEEINKLPIHSNWTKTVKTAEMGEKIENNKLDFRADENPGDSQRFKQLNVINQLKRTHKVKLV